MLIHKDTHKVRNRQHNMHIKLMQEENIQKWLTSTQKCEVTYR